MAYNEFAYFYDEFNGEADYDALYGYITDELKAHGITDGILADLGCGTGDLTLMLTQAGYDVIGTPLCARAAPPPALSVVCRRQPLSSPTTSPPRDIRSPPR